MRRSDSDQELEERRITSPREGQSNKKRYNVNDKIFICPCGKDYSKYQSLDYHVKTKHKDDLQERRKKIKQTLDKLFENVENVPEIKAKDVPTFQEESDHKENSIKAYNLICTLWRTLPPQTYGIVDEVIFDRKKYKVEKGDSTYEDVIKSRKEALNHSVQELLQLHYLQQLYRLVGSNKEFKDYWLKDDKLEAKYTLNFTWDLVKYFKPSFAAKIQVFLYAICCKDILNLNSMEGWTSFKAREWSNYAFIEPILQEYHQKWLARDQRNIMYQF